MSTQSHIDKVNLRPNILPYGAHVGAPSILPQNITPFKQRGVEKVDKIIKKRYDEIMKEADTLYKSYLLNEEIYNSKFSFEPVIGETYYLYDREDGTKFLSMIKPSEWGKTPIFSVILNADMTWSEIMS